MGGRLVAAVAAVVVLAASAAPAPAAGPAPAQVEGDGVQVEGVSQTAYVGRDGMWNLVLDVSGAPAGSTVEATVREEVETRDAYLGASFYGIVGERVLSLPDVALDDVPRRGGRREVSLAVSLRQDPPAGPQPPGWAFVERGLLPGVYPVDVRVVDADGIERDRLVVPLTRVPTGEEAGADAPALQVAPVVRLGAVPDLPEAVADAQELDPPPFTVADLADEVAGLAAGIEEADDLPLTLVPRPESIEALGRTDDGERARDDLRAASRGAQVVDGPYVELPIGTWVAARLDDELTRQRERGHTVLTQQVGRVDGSTWDATGGITAEAAASLWSVGVRTLLLGRDGLEPAGPVDGPVTIAAAPDRQLEAVVPDGSLSDALTRRGDLVLDSAGLAAELALTAAARPAPSGVVIVPPVGWSADPDAVVALEAVLTHELAPVVPVSLAAFLDAVPSRGPRALAPAIQPDLSLHAVRLATARSQLSSYASLVGSGADEVARLDLRLLLSGSADLTPEQRSALVDESIATTSERFEAVRAPSRQTVTLTSSTGDIPLTIDNDLEVPVRVVIDLRSEGRVEFRGTPRMTTVLDPGRNTVSIPVRARAPGDSTIDIVVRTPDDVVEVDEVRYTVRSSALSGIGVVLSGGAIVFLVVWWGRHWAATRRARRSAAGAAPAT